MWWLNLGCYVLAGMFSCIIAWSAIEVVFFDGEYRRMERVELDNIDIKNKFSLLRESIHNSLKFPSIEEGKTYEWNGVNVLVREVNPSGMAKCMLLEYKCEDIEGSGIPIHHKKYSTIMIEQKNLNEIEEK